MTTMMEKAALAVRVTARSDDDGYVNDPEDVVRAVLQAIREPSDEMLAPACRTHRPGEPMSETRPEECPAISRRRARFTAMIDAILNEPNNTP